MAETLRSAMQLRRFAQVTDAVLMQSTRHFPSRTAHVVDPVSKGVVPKVWLMPIKNPVESQD